MSITASNSVASDRAVLTLAMGPAVYWQMAINLARSLRRWHRADEMPMTIATDQTASLPRDLIGVDVIRIKAGTLGIGFQTKLHLDQLAPATHTLFIDADCLVYSRLDEAFTRFSGQPVGVLQESIVSHGEYFGDVAAYCRRLGVNAVPRFTGGIYYVEPATAIPVYTEARNLFAQYDELGFVRLRGLQNEEVLLAGAMARHNLWGMPDDGTIIGDFQRSPGDFSLDLLRGRRRLSNPPNTDPRHCSFAPVRSINPMVVHFQAYHTQLPSYRAETAALAWTTRGIPDALARAIAHACILWPGKGKSRMKALLRPVFRRLFGLRAVPPTDRMTADKAPPLPRIP